MCAYRDAALLQLEPQRERLPHEDVGVMAREEGPLQLLQLPAVEVGPAAPPLAAAVVVVAVAACKQGGPPLIRRRDSPVTRGEDESPQGQPTGRRIRAGNLCVCVCVYSRESGGVDVKGGEEQVSFGNRCGMNWVSAESAGKSVRS